MTRRSRRRLLGLALGLASVFALGCGEACSCEGPRPEAEAVTVYVVRHAEKEKAPEDAPEELRKDPPLSSAGQLRAMSLTEDIPVETIDAVFVTRTRRSEHTAGAVLALTGLEPIYYPPRDVEGLIARLRRRHGQSILVVGHSNTIPALLEALGLGKIEIDEDQYGDLWVVTLRGLEADVERRSFGGSAEPFDPGL